MCKKWPLVGWCWWLCSDTLKLHCEYIKTRLIWSPMSYVNSSSLLNTWLRQPHQMWWYYREVVHRLVCNRVMCRSNPQLPYLLFQMVTCSGKFPKVQNLMKTPHPPKDTCILTFVICAQHYTTGVHACSLEIYNIFK